MKRIRVSQVALASLAAATPPVPKASEKQLNFLVRDLQHPSLHAKKYDESLDIWQARVNRNWRFWFEINGDTYDILDLAPHPK